MRLKLDSKRSDNLHANVDVLYGSALGDVWIAEASYDM